MRIPFVLAAAFMFSTGAAAEPICSGPAIQFIVPFSAGTTIDSATRLVARAIEQDLAHPVTVVNQPGASGQIAASALSAMEFDGCSFGAFASAPVNLFGIKKRRAGDGSYDPMNDFIAVGRMYAPAFVLVVNKQLSVTSYGSFAAHVREHPGAVKIAVSYALGDATIALLRRQTGEIVPVPYRKGDVTSLPDITTDRVQGAVMSTGIASPRVKSGELTPLFVVGLKRDPGMPDVPTVGELGIRELDRVDSWVGLVAPRKLRSGFDEKKAETVVRRMNDALKRALEQTKPGLTALSITADHSSPEEHAAQIRTQIDVWDDLERRGLATLE